MPRWRIRRSQEISYELGRLIVETTNDSFEVLEPKFKALERRLLAQITSDFERREVRRRIAEEFVNAAFGLNCPWPIFGRALRRIQRLGYSHVERRFHVAALYALWCRHHPEHDSRQARRMLDEAEQRVRRLPRAHVRRREILGRIDDIRARAGFRAAPKGGPVQGG